MQALLSRYRWHVRYQCPRCSWCGIIALPLSMTDQELVQWFSCPVHGDPRDAELYVPTKMYRMDLHQLASKK